MKSFAEELQAYKRWAEFEKWYNQEYGDEIIYSADSYGHDYAKAKEFISHYNFAFQSGVLLQFLREKCGVSYIELYEKTWIEGGWQANLNGAGNSDMGNASATDPDLALQEAILTAFNL